MSPQPCRLKARRANATALAGLVALLAWALPAAGALQIDSPADGAVVYQEEGLSLRARWSGEDAPAEPLGFRWVSDREGVLGEGLDLAAKRLNYATRRLRVEALAGDSVIASAEARVTVVQRPVQFTLSENDDWEGEFSAGSGLVAYTSFRSGGAEVWVAGPDGRGVRRVTMQGGLGPSWAADGRLVFWTERAGGRQLWVTDPHGGGNGTVQLTAGPAANWMADCHPREGRAVYVSRDGARRCLMQVDLSAQDPPATATELLGAEHEPMYPRFFPDGQAILFTSYREPLPVICRFVPAEGKVTALSRPGAEDADVSPDGSRVVMVREGELWLLELAGGEERQLTAEQGRVLSPRFTAEGRRVIYASARSGNYDLWVLNLPD